MPNITAQALAIHGLTKNENPMLHELKKKYIGILQTYSVWGKEEAIVKKNSEEMYAFLVETNGKESVEKFKSRPEIKLRTAILVATHTIQSPIELDHTIELPIVELFLDDDNFVVFTTQGIYSCRKAKTHKIAYTDIVGIDNKHLNQVLRDKQPNSRYIEVELITRSNKNFAMTVEHSIPFKPIIYFLTKV